MKSLAIDLSKDYFQLHGADEKNKCVLKKRLGREALLPFMAQLPSCTVYMEACGGAQDWRRRFEAMGHTVQLIHAKYVKPFVRSQKNDARDAEAILTACTQPHAVFVPKKAIEQQDIQCLHRVRSRLVKQRTMVINQAQGLLTEYGIILPQSIHQFRQKIQTLLSSNPNLTELAQTIFQGLYEEVVKLDELILTYEKQLKAIFKQHQACQRLAQIPGVGLLTATAVVADIGYVSVFKNGRHLAAFLGVVPKQRSSGSKQTLLGITKRGDAYLRTLLVHGARAVLREIHKKDNPYARWIQRLLTIKHKNVVSLAIANKQARIIWALLKNTDDSFSFEKAVRQVIYTTQTILSGDCQGRG